MQVQAGSMVRTQVTADCRVRFRVAGPQDAAMIRDFINGLTVRTQFLRFFAAVAPPSSGLLRGLCGTGGSADIVVAFQHGSVIGHGMAADRVGPDGVLASDIGLVVADGWQQRGVGTELLRLVVARASARGARMLVMDVLPGNDRMLGMIERRWPGASRELTADSVIIRACLTERDRDVAVQPAA
jgi:ribosomal protein S18 acetylase RimI-like enzyme